MKKIISILVIVVAAITSPAISSAQVVGEFVSVICKNGQSYSGVVVSSNNAVLKLKVNKVDERLIYVEDIVKVIRSVASSTATAPSVSKDQQIFTEKYFNEHIGEKANVILSKGKSSNGVYILGAKGQCGIFNRKPSYGPYNAIQQIPLQDIKAIELLDVEPGFKLTFELSSFHEMKDHTYDIAVENGTTYEDVVILDYDVCFGSLLCKNSNGRRKNIPLLKIKGLTRKY